MTTFADLGLSESMLEALRDVGYESPSPIQEQAIPELLQGRDVIGQAQTGTGKTAAFGLPMIEFTDPDEQEVQALVLTPTRELCIQVTQALRAYAQRKGVDVVAVFGGAPIRTQQAQLKQGGQIVVGTVGRVLDLISRRSLMLHDCRYLVLDEADEMLDLGFLEDVERILSLTPGGRQTALFSATMPAGDPRPRRPPPLRPGGRQGQGGDADHRHRRAVLPRDQAGAQERRAGARARGRAARPGDRLHAHEDPLRPALPHAARPRDERQGAARGHDPGPARRRDAQPSRAGRLPILVATDVAARGLDIRTVTHIINFDVPTSPDVYVHRIGRTGRVGRSGRAITFVEPRQARELQAIEKHANTHIAPWAEGAKVAPARLRESSRRRHRKPHDVRADRERRLHEADRQRRPRRGAGRGRPHPRGRRRSRSRRRGDPQRPDARALRAARGPGGEAERVADAVDGTSVRGHTLRLEAARN